MGACDDAFGVSLGETASSADLGGSSKYSNENFEGRSGEGFHVNSTWTWVLDLKRPGCSAHAGARLNRNMKQPLVQTLMEVAVIQCTPLKPTWIRGL